MTLSKSRIEELERAERKLLALENGGVDSWHWYDEALKEYYKEESLDEIISYYVDEIAVEILSGAYEPSERGSGYSTGSDNIDGAKALVIEMIDKVRWKQFEKELETIKAWNTRADKATQDDR